MQFFANAYNLIYIDLKEIWFSFNKVAEWPTKTNFCLA